jgi:methylmalonyl-CoA epimerase
MARASAHGGGLPVDHLGIAVRSLSEAVPRWEKVLGASASPPEVVESQRVRVSFLAAGETHLELLEPTSPESTIARFLEKRGEGLHHVAFRVPDLPRHLAELRAQGVRLLDETPRAGARGRWVAFAHPSSLGGVLTEFVQPRMEGPA